MTMTTTTLHDAETRSGGGGGGLQDYIPAEMELAAQLGGKNPKNYQIWYH